MKEVIISNLLAQKMNIRKNCLINSMELFFNEWTYSFSQRDETFCIYVFND